MPSKNHLSRSGAAVGVAIVWAFLACLPNPADAQKRSRAATYYDDALARYDGKDTAGAIIQLHIACSNGVICTGKRTGKRPLGRETKRFNP